MNNPETKNAISHHKGAFTNAVYMDVENRAEKVFDFSFPQDIDPISLITAEIRNAKNIPVYNFGLLAKNQEGSFTINFHNILPTVLNTQYSLHIEGMGKNKRYNSKVDLTRDHPVKGKIYKYPFQNLHKSF